jgi:hypothetical protein
MKYVFMKQSYAKLDFMIGKTDSDDIQGEEYVFIYDLMGVDEDRIFHSEKGRFPVRSNELYGSERKLMKDLMPYLFN